MTGARRPQPQPLWRWTWTWTRLWTRLWLWIALAAAAALALRPTDQQPLSASERIAQEYLRRYGYLEKNHGLMIEALEDFQLFAGLNVTGRLDPNTAQLMKQPRCGVRDRLLFRSKRYALQGTRWRVRNITYRISQYPKKLPPSDVDRVIQKAFELWAAPSDLSFRALDSGWSPEQGAKAQAKAKAKATVDRSGERVHIEIRWEQGSHGDWDSFDGRGGTLGHASYPRYGGDIHFDADEDWALDEHSAGQKRPSLLHIAAHEIGHALGLHHSNVSGAVMAPFYRYFSPFQLHFDDVNAITALYGKAALPAAARPTEESPLCKNPVFDAIFSDEGFIYILQGDSYYRYNSRRLDPPGPQPIAKRWRGLPGNLDAAFKAKNGRTYFFKGTQYWRFKRTSPEPGYPKLVRDGFPGIPDRVDAAFVWSGNGKLYFFKGDRFWKYDAEQTPHVNWRYPKAVSNWEGLPDDVDAALDFKGRTYFFKGGLYYRFNDSAFAVEESATPFPRRTAYWWFHCRNKTQGPSSIRQLSSRKCVKPARLCFGGG